MSNQTQDKTTAAAPMVAERLKQIFTEDSVLKFLFGGIINDLGREQAVRELKKIFVAIDPADVYTSLQLKLMDDGDKRRHRGDAWRNPESQTRAKVVAPSKVEHVQAEPVMGTVLINGRSPDHVFARHVAQARGTSGSKPFVPPREEREEANKPSPMMRPAPPRPF